MRLKYSKTFTETLPAAKWHEWLNPYWWASDVELAKYPKWSWLKWFKRNPFSNFKSRIVGVAYIKPRVWRSNVTNGQLWAYHGWSFAITTIPYVPIALPWVGYRAKYEMGIGWKTDGSFCPFMYRKAHSKNATEIPN